MSTEFDRVCWDARRAGGRLPTAALPQLGEIEDVIEPLLEHLTNNQPSMEEQIAIESMVTDYLPTAIRTYTGLNEQAAQATRPDGTSPGGDLLDQLRTLTLAAEDLSSAVYAHDSQQLATHGRFLSTKFSGSDLDL